MAFCSGTQAVMLLATVPELDLYKYLEVVNEAPGHPFCASIANALVICGLCSCTLLGVARTVLVVFSRQLLPW